MAEGILGLGSSGSNDLSSELIEKLKTAETTAILDPITEDIEDAEAELEAVTAIETMSEELLELIKEFDLYTSDTNIFDQVTASTSGSSVSFDATDTSNLDPGTISVTVDQLAQKDVYQSNIISDITEEMTSGTISITIGENTYEFDTDGKTYEDLESEMNNYSTLDVALEQVGDESYRFVIKSSESGTTNALTITQTDIDLGLEDEDNHVLTAQNMLASVDGIDYDLSGNKISMSNGLIITAVEEGDSSITLSRDESGLADAIQAVADKYNELVDLVDSYIYGDDEETAVISDSSTIRTMMTGIKEIFMSTYGLDDEENMFVYGISFDTDGYMQIDTSELAEAITNNYDDLKELFVGYAEKEGIGTQLKTYLDSLDSITDGLLSTLEDKIQDRIDELEEEYEEESDRLDEKYEQMSEQFAAYTVIITEMENAFASLQLIIDSESSD